MRRRPFPGIDAGLALGLGIASTLAYYHARQDPFWSDGKNLVALLSEGSWTHHHLLFLPLARIAWSLVAPIATPDPRAMLEILSAAATGAAVALLYAAARSSGIGRKGALLGALLLATAPSVVFFATCVEVHAVQLLCATLAYLWALRAERAGRLGADALAPALVLALLLASHVSAVVCVPAFLLLVLGRRGASPDRPLPALTALAAFAVAWLVANAGTVVPAIGSEALKGIATTWDPSFAWSELVLPAGVLYPLALVACLGRGRAFAELVAAPLPRAFVALILTLVPFAMTFHVGERGAYYSWALPGLALCAGRWLDTGHAARLLLGLGLAALQLSWARSEVRAWVDEYPGHEWIPRLETELGPEGLVIALGQLEAMVLRNHAGVRVIHPNDVTVPDPERFASSLVEVLDRALRRGRIVGITRESFGRDDPAGRHVVEELVARHGPPATGRHPAYLLWREQRPVAAASGTRETR